MSIKDQLARLWSKEKLLNLVVILSLLTVYVIGFVFIHQVTVPVAAVNFFGLLLPGGMVYDIGLILLGVVFVILGACYVLK